MCQKTDALRECTKSNSKQYSKERKNDRRRNIKEHHVLYNKESMLPKVKTATQS